MNYNHPIDGGAIRGTWMAREEDLPRKRHRHGPHFEAVPMTHRRLEDCPESALYSAEQRAMAAINSMLREAVS